MITEGIDIPRGTSRLESGLYKPFATPLRGYGVMSAMNEFLKHIMTCSQEVTVLNYITHKKKPYFPVNNDGVSDEFTSKNYSYLFCKITPNDEI